MAERREQVFVKAFLAPPSVEAFDQSVPHRIARLRFSASRPYGPFAISVSRSKSVSVPQHIRNDADAEALIACAAPKLCSR